MAEPAMMERVGGSPRLRREQRIARGLVRTFGRVEVEGIEHVPAEGPVIFAVNHRSLMDGPLLFGLIERPVACLVKSEAFVPVVRALLLGAGQIPVARHTIDPYPVRQCLQILRAGGVIGVFPEGTRGDGQVRHARPGVGYFAMRTGATVVPVACHGTAEMVRTFRRHPVHVEVGRPMTFAAYPAALPLNRRLSAAATERVRAELAALVGRTSVTTRGAAA